MHRKLSTSSRGSPQSVVTLSSQSLRQRSKVPCSGPNYSGKHWTRRWTNIWNHLQSWKKHIEACANVESTTGKVKQRQNNVVSISTYLVGAITSHENETESLKQVLCTLGGLYQSITRSYYREELVLSYNRCLEYTHKYNNVETTRKFIAIMNLRGVRHNSRLW